MIIPDFDKTYYYVFGPEFEEDKPDFKEAYTYPVRISSIHKGYVTINGQYFDQRMVSYDDIWVTQEEANAELQKRLKTMLVKLESERDLICTRIDNVKYLINTK